MIDKSLNNITLIGVVCSRRKKYIENKQLHIEFRIRLDQTKSSPIYVDLIAKDSLAKKINVLGNLGSLVYVEGHFINKLFKKGKGETKVLLLIELSEFVLLNEMKSAKKIDYKKVFEIISELHPVNFEGGEL